ncbi:YkgJ family cysteine cluster protein [Xanthomonas campestris pv. raphani]|uniref:YkgJ family cysteine cluster protein n=1 Tax=Xanthomonas campestris TaxID=339 RepID=UPI002B23DEBA|nr:YkgJ family cysteine cluster protein [Xanthomonas campestris]MEA9786697.1 YkgJ family cysteine cluster protein [Xanthomonas campestris pv. raphani]
MTSTLSCRAGCAACCIAPSISSPIPGVPCVQLDAQWGCRLFGQPSRPAVCASLRPSVEMCGSSRTQALAMLAALERATQP